MERKFVQNTLSSDGFSLDNIKLEAIADEFIKVDEDMKELDRYMIDGEAVLKGQDFDQEQDSNAMFKSNKFS